MMRTKTRKIATSVRITSDLREDLMQIAEREGISFNALCEELLSNCADYRSVQGKLDRILKMLSSR
jgi:predicted DNA-binding ribbon-helix-helix protein